MTKFVFGASKTQIVCRGAILFCFAVCRSVKKRDFEKKNAVLVFVLFMLDKASEKRWKIKLEKENLKKKQKIYRQTLFVFGR